MADMEHPEGGLRRRHSTHSTHSESDSECEIPSSSGAGRLASQDGEQDSAELSARLRFSADVERHAKSKRRKSDAVEYPPSEAAERSKYLTVDAGTARSEHVHHIMGEGTDKLPSDTLSPVPVDPAVPQKSRSRGMSLRSSLFLRNINRSPSPGQVELQALGSSSNNRVSRPSSSKKSTAAFVTVSSIPEENVFPPYQQAKRALPGTPALPNYQRWVERHTRRKLPLKNLHAAYERARKFALGIQDIPPSKNGRQLPLEPSKQANLIDERTGQRYISNVVRSSKYTPWNFIPRQLFAQFSKLANAYFLCVSILQMIPGLSTTGTYTTIVPLLFFVSLSMAKEGYEDLRRHRLDQADNNREAHVLRANQADPPVERDMGQAIAMDDSVHWAPATWQNLQVGDIVRLRRDDAVPADIVLLGSKNSNNIAYVETMALDGETNLKNKQPVAAIAKVARNVDTLASLKIHLTVEDPNLNLYSFEGKVTVDEETVPLTINEVIYRGSVLRNTPEAVGCVIYTGEECKIRMNASKNPRIKSPSLQASVNKIVVLIVCFVVFLALFNTVAYQIWNGTTEQKAWYLSRAHVPFGHILVSFIIMFNTMIPLSLYVSMEIIKLAQMVLLNDIDMYDPESNTPFEARTSTINEELGQVKYIFSDKTGTLTENIMKLRKLSVAGTAWLHDIDLKGEEAGVLLRHKKRRDKGKGPARRLRESSSHATLSKPSAANVPDGTDSTQLPRASTGSRWKSNAMPGMPQTESGTSDLIKYTQQRPRTAFAHKAKMMLLSMALCHTCLPERLEDADEVTFQASSPDEVALVQAAKELGFVAWERDNATLKLKTFPDGLHAEPVLESYEILDVIEFSSKRKRMSAIARFPDGRIAIICKGADSVIMERLRLASFARQKLSEIEKRDIQRKSMEAAEALRRKSSHAESGSTLHAPRTSTSLARHSANLGRPSIGRLPAIRDEVDGWLHDREHDVDTSPKASSNFAARASLAISELPGSLYYDVADLMVPDDDIVLNDAAVLERCFQQMNDFATEGLRTLLYAYRFLDEEEYRNWKKVYHDAATSLVDRQLLIERAGELIEQQLELGGATAIEDKLQKGVPETIERLRRAGIKTWMLTGDKRETAVNIAQSCRLIKDYSLLTVLDYETGDVEQNIAAAIIDINRNEVAHSVVVIDGQTLGMIESNTSLHVLFLDLAILADSVICSRSSPSQKAGLVHAIRTRSPSVTLAIGDGANDVAMVMEAHVGIGITGREGLQCARSSDYSIAQFRFLGKLLLVHGRWNYIRTSKYILGTFWKEMVFYLTQAFFQRSNGYTGTSLYESWSLSMFNTLFTSLIVIFLGIFEQDLRASTLLAVPELYTKGQRSTGFNFKVYIGWMLTAVSDSVIIYYTMHYLYGRASFTDDNTIYPMGDLTFTVAIVLIAIKLQILEQRNRTVMAVVAFVLSVGGWFLWEIILSAVYKKNEEYAVRGGFFDRFGRSSLWWLTLILTVAACSLFEIGVRALKAAIYPTDVETFQTLEQDLGLRKRFEEASAPWMQAGWNHGSKRSSSELQQDAAEQAKRESEVQDLLNRPRVMEEGRSRGRSIEIETEEQTVFVEDGPERRSTDIQELLSRRFGNVRHEDMAHTR